MTKLPPRLSLLTVALILVLRDQGRSFRMIVEHRRVRKKDGSLVTQQAARKVVERHKLPRRTWASWTPNGEGKGGRGRPPKVLSAESATRIKQCIEKHRFVGVVRVPWIKKHLKLKCSRRTVAREVERLGYSLCRLSPKRVLDSASKRKRVTWALEHSARRPVWWRRRAYADAHFWYLPRTRAEASGNASPRAIYRKAREGKSPKFHGGKGTGYKQGRRLGVWGVLTAEGFSVAFLPAGRVSGSSHASLVRKYYGRWAGQCPVVFHDGERALHSPPAMAAYAAVGVQCGKLPPSSPDLNPIENVWSLLDLRLARTKPPRWESEKAFRVRVRNAVLWLNSSRGDVLKRLISSMPRRLQACVALKGARTPY